MPICPGLRVVPTLGTDPEPRRGTRILRGLQPNRSLMTSMIRVRCSASGSCWVTAAGVLTATIERDEMRKRSRTLKVHPALLERAEDRAVLESRSLVSVVEQALAELLHVPILDRRFPEGPVEICARCRAGVMWQGRCPVCGHHGRAERPARARDRPDLNRPK